MHKSVLNRQFFTADQILQAKQLIQHQFGFQLDLINVNSIQVNLNIIYKTILVCRNQKIYKCGFIYLFRKNNGNKDQTLYSLITQLQSHNECCVKQNEKHSATSEISTPKIRSSSFSQYTGPQTKNYLLSPISILGNFQIQRQDELSKMQQDQMQKQQIFIEKSDSREFSECQFPILKKQLQFQSRGLISKSTQFHSQEGYVTKVNFKCKFDIKCPFLVELNYLNQRDGQQRLYQLKKINVDHLESCILDQEQIHFNVTTRKIDKHMGLLIQIIHQNMDAKPKTILQFFANSIEMKEDFIYEGLSSKLKRRAIKKYFDNSVAKARNIAKQ